MNENIHSIQIANRRIGPDSAPYVVAEMSGNHNQSLDRALAIIEAAAKAGAHALKIQTYTSDTMTIDSSDGEFFISDDKSLWKGSSLYDLYKQAYTPWEWHKPIFDHCKKLGITCFSTPFDESAVDFLDSLGVPAFKIASFENIDLPLIRKAASKGKPLIISTGMATIAELDEAVKAARGAGCKELLLLKCTSTYPATPENTNILTIPHMRELFQCPVGLSDHSMGLGVAVGSVALGACFVEKHFTLSREQGGVDSSFSAEPQELKQLVEETRQAWQALGRVSYGPVGAETKSLQFRRSLYVVQDVKAGERLTEKSVRSIRPGKGLPPKFLEMVLGKVVRKDVKRGTPLSWELFE